MTDNYKFFSNKKCEYYPCHPLPPGEDLNCLFCFCPLYSRSDCGGDFTILDNGIKDCSECTLVHGISGYSHVISKLMEDL